MDVLALAARRVKPVEVDHCPGCRLVWFDPLESVMLAGLGWVQLLRRLGSTPAVSPDLAAPSPPCPVCRSTLVPVHNRTRFGRFPALECPHRHGHLHSHAGLLAERGLVRGLLPAERGALVAEKRRLHCLCCGASVDGQSDACSFCGSPLVVVDLPRLAHALTVQTATDGAAPPPAGLLLAWPCRGCGAPLDPVTQTECPGCGHALVAAALPDLNPLLDSAEEALQPPAPRPWRPPPARRPLSWRDTQLQRLRNLWRDEEQQAASPAGAAGALALVVVVFLVLWLLRR
jgi:hypothetical protein